MLMSNARKRENGVRMKKDFRVSDLYEQVRYRNDSCLLNRRNIATIRAIIYVGILRARPFCTVTSAVLSWDKVFKGRDLFLDKKENDVRMKKDLRVHDSYEPVR